MDVALGSSRDATEHVNRNNNDGYHAGQNVHHGGRGDFRGRGGRGGKGRGRGHNKNYKQRSINRDGALSTPRFPDQNQGRGGRGGGRGKGRYKKRLPANQRERLDDEELSDELKIATELVTRIADFSSFSPGEEKDLVNNIMNVTRPMIELGDLIRMSGEMSDLFVKCLTHLPLQVPVISTIVGLINTTKHYHSFASLVVEKLGTQLEYCLNELNIPKAKLALRALACLTCCGAVPLTSAPGGDQNSFVQLLTNLVDAMDNTLLPSSSHNVVVGLLVTSVIPWCAEELRNKGGDQGSVLCARIMAEVVLPVCSTAYSSDYGVDGKYSSFVINCMEGDDADIWDSLQRQCKTAQMLLDPASGAPASMFTMHIWRAFDSELNSISTFSDIDRLPDQDDEDDDAMAMVEPDDRTAIVQNPLVFVTTEPNDDTTSLTADSIREYVSKGVSTHRSDTRYVDLENRDNKDRNVCMGGWFSLVSSVFTVSEPNHPLACLSLMDKTIIGDYIRDILVFFEPYIRADGTYIGSTALLTQHLLSIHKLYSVNLLLNNATDGIDHDTVRVACDYLIVETILQMLIQIPSFNPLCLHKVLLELCRVAVSSNASVEHSIPRIVATGCVGLYQLAPAMDTSAWKAITTWLSYHLANFKLSWPYWQYWSEEYTSDDGSTAGAAQTNDVSKVFIQDVVDKCARLSFPTAMKNALPEPLHECIPCQDYLASETTPLCYVLLPVASIVGAGADANLELSEVQSATKELYTRMLAKADGAAVEEWLDEVYLQAAPEGIETYTEEYSETWKCCALMEAVMYIGSAGRTMSNITTVMDRYGELLRSYSYNAENGQQAMLCALHHMYSAISGGNSGDWGMFNIVLDMLVRRSIVSCTSALEWLLGSNKNASYWHGIPSTLVSDVSSGLIAQIINSNVVSSGDMVAGHHMAWDHVDTIITRSFDFVLAAIARKDELLVQIETINNELTENHKNLSNIGESTNAKLTGGTSDGDAEMAMATIAPTQKEDDSDSDDDIRGKRRRGGEADAVVTYNQNNHPDDINDDVDDDGVSRSDITLAIEHLQSELTKSMEALESNSTSLTISITGAREAFVVITGQLMLQVNMRYSALTAGTGAGGGAAADDSLALDPLLVTHCSLLRHVLRLYESHQILLAASMPPGVSSSPECALSDRASVELLTMDNSVGTTTLTTSAGMGQSLVSNPLVQRIWNHFA